MKTAKSLFNKVLVLNYYKRNAVFLLIILLFAFGFLSGNEHMAIIRSIISSPKTFAYVLLLWLVYDIKIIAFVLKQLNLPAFRLLYDLQFYPKKDQLYILAVSQFNLTHLTNFYAMLIISVSILDGIYWPIIFILTYKFFAVIISSYIYLKRIALPSEGGFLGFNISFNFIPSIKTYYGIYFTGHLIHNYAVTFLITKGFSILILDSFFLLYPTDAYDFRLFGLAAIIVSIVNVKLLQLYLEFENSYLQFTFNLPFSFIRRYSYYAINIFWVMIPDILTFVWKSKSILELNQILSWSLFYFFLVMIILELIFFYQKKQDQALQTLFFIMVVFSLLIMYKSSLYILTICMLVLSTYYYRQRITHKKRDY